MTNFNVFNIFSCIETTDKNSSRASSLAKQALDRGLKSKASFFISPGSEKVQRVNKIKTIIIL
jgi:hypothetical protein